VRALTGLTGLTGLDGAAGGGVTSVTRPCGTGTAPVLGHQWFNPGNVTASDDTYASCLLPAFASSDDLFCTNFGFAIPGGATILGVRVDVELKQDNSGGGQIKDSSVRLLRAGTPVGGDHADASSGWPMTDAVKSYGGAADLWGAAWAPADVNDPGFGVVIDAEEVAGGMTGATAFIDFVQITVTYQ
jgi:hypothetical protein